MKSFLWRGPATLVDIRAGDVVVDRMAIFGQVIDLPEDDPLVVAWSTTGTIEPVTPPTSAAPSRARRRPGDTAPSDQGGPDVTVTATPMTGE